MSFREFRACQIDGGCPPREGEIEDFAATLSTQFGPIALAGKEISLESDCVAANEVLSSKDPAAKYLDDQPVSLCPRIAQIQFEVLESYDA